MMKKYLVIWQNGTNDQSRTDTPVDVQINNWDNAYDTYDKILKKLKDVSGNEHTDDIRILGIHKL